MLRIRVVQCLCTQCEGELLHLYEVCLPVIYVVIRPHRSYCPSGGLPRGSLGPAIGGFACNCPMPEAWTIYIYINKTEKLDLNNDTLIQ